MDVYPDSSSARDAWVVARRGPRNALAPDKGYAQFVEIEPNEDGQPTEVFTVFLTNRECPWRCLMCDLWQNTLEVSVPPGAIPAQISKAIQDLGPTGAGPKTRRFLKLYNAGSFFDPHAIPTEDYPAIAALCAPFERVIVESHPALINARFDLFQSALRHGRSNPATILEVALGLETTHPVARDRLNKRVTLDQFQAAASRIIESGATVRAFVLVAPPFLGGDDPVESAVVTARFAVECGTGVVALIPTRGGNGAMEALRTSGDWAPPTLRQLENAFDQTIGSRQPKTGSLKPRIFVDTWDLERFSNCAACFPARRARLEAMNLSQTSTPRITCIQCGISS